MLIDGRHVSANANGQFASRKRRGYVMAVVDNDGLAYPSGPPWQKPRDPGGRHYWSLLRRPLPPSMTIPSGLTSCFTQHGKAVRHYLNTVTFLDLQFFSTAQRRHAFAHAAAMNRTNSWPVGLAAYGNITLELGRLNPISATGSPPITLLFSD